MAFGTISPVAIQQFHDNNGNPLAGGKLFFYEAGTSTPTPAYADYGLTTPLSNPVILDAGGRAPELFLAALSYKQVLQDALGTTLWSADNIVTPTALRSTSATTSITGAANNVPIPAGIISFLTFASATDVTVSGFAGGTPGQILIVRSEGTGTVYLLNASALSADGNRTSQFAGSGPAPLANDRGVAIYVYEYPFWVMIAHEQGKSLRLPFDANRFYLGDGSAGNQGQWVVQSGDVKSLDYRLSGSVLTISIALENTSVVPVGGGAYLWITSWPYQFQQVAYAIPAIAGTAYENAIVSNGTDRIAIINPGLTNWPAGTDNYRAIAQLTLDVL